MTRRLFRSRLGILGLTAWLVAASAVLFDRSDPEARFYRLEQSVCLLGTLQYRGCSMGTPRLDLAETVDYYCLDAMATIHGWIADLRGEPAIDWGWLKRESARRRAPVRSENREAEAMGRRMQR